MTRLGNPALQKICTCALDWIVRSNRPRVWILDGALIGLGIYICFSQNPDRIRGSRSTESEWISSRNAWKRPTTFVPPGTLAPFFLTLCSGVLFKRWIPPPQLRTFNPERADCSVAAKTWQKIDLSSILVLKTLPLSPTVKPMYTEGLNLRGLSPPLSSRSRCLYVTFSSCKRQHFFPAFTLSH